MIFSRIIIKYCLFYAYTLMLSNFALHGYSFGGSAHGVVPAFFYRYPGRPRVGWRRYEPAPETSSLETVSSSEESCELQYGRLTRARSQPSNVATPEREWAHHGMACQLSR